MPTRTLQRVIAAIPTSDGAGVKLQRSLGQSNWARLDPFLMLDHFSTDNADDYIAGFPAHPHRGFETVTYMLDGHMRHQDHLGNTGRSESRRRAMDERGARHHPFRNAAAGGRAACAAFSSGSICRRKEKMKPAGYRDIQATEIPVVELAGGGRVKVIAGTLEHRRPCARPGPIQGLSTDPLYFDVELPGGRDVPSRAARRPSRLRLSVRGLGRRRRGAARDACSRRTTRGSCRRAMRSSSPAEPEGGRVILLAGRPLLEPIVQYGPFVMNTREEIEQAVRDYQSGKLTGSSAAAHAPEAAPAASAHTLSRRTKNPASAGFFLRR